MPVQPLEAAVQTWRKVCTNPVDRKVEEELRKVRPPLQGHLYTEHLLFTQLGPSSLFVVGWTYCFLNWVVSTWELFTSRYHI